MLKARETHTSFRTPSLTQHSDQPLLYAFFGLSQAVAGDLGIAISMAAEGTLVRSKLNANLIGYTNAEEVGRITAITLFN